MAVIIEGISIVIKDKSLIDKFSGGIDRFKNEIPDNTYCTDKHLHRIGFMTPADVESFAKALESCGLEMLKENNYEDFAVVDMLRGTTLNCDWLGFLRYKMFTGMTEYKSCEEDFSMAWLLNSDNQQNSFSSVDGSYKLSVPVDWNPDNALYSRNFVGLVDKDKKLMFIGMEGNLLKYLHSDTGEFVYVGSPDIKRM